MAGRRSHPRVVMASPWNGVISVLRDAVIEDADGKELLVLSHSPGVIGETLSVHLLGAGASLQLSATVAESRPVIVDGSVQYRLRLLVASVADGHGTPESQGA